MNGDYSGGRVRKDLEEGAPATTLLVCPHVKAWDSFEAFQEFYQAKLMNGYLYAEKDRCSAVSTIYDDTNDTRV